MGIGMSNNMYLLIQLQKIYRTSRKIKFLFFKNCFLTSTATRKNF